MILQNGNYVGKYSRKFVRRWVNQIYFLVVQSPPCVLLMEVRPKQFGLRCIATNLVPQTPLCFSPIFTDTQGTKEGRVGESPFFYNDSTNLAGPDMVPWVNSFVNEKSPTLTSINKFLKESSRGNAHSSLKSNNEVRCLGYYRQHMANEGISERASNIILSSRREGTNSNYCSSWNKWASWCDKHKFDPFRRTLKWVLYFLAELFQQGYQYRSVFSHRPAISPFHEGIDGKVFMRVHRLAHLSGESLTKGYHNTDALAFGMSN